MSKKCMRPYQTGAVSLFVVIFAALLMTVVTVGFIQLMVKDQQQASAHDLSQSAYDSAQAGVEDAKRLLLAVQACGGSTDPTCKKMEGAVTSQTCDTIAASGLVGTTNGETLIQQTSSDTALNQAYTCVKIATKTDNYQGKLAQNESNIIPLRATDQFDTVTLSWFSRDDLSAGTTAIDYPATGGVTLPPTGAAWGATVPPLMRAQLIQTGSSFNLSDFDGGNSNTLFFYPAKAGAAVSDFALDARRDNTSAGAAPQPIVCTPSLGVNSLYACSVSIKVPSPVGGSPNQRSAYLRLSALYNATHYAVTLSNGATPVQFDNVQPAVDSTGRANSLFRRVSARVELKGSMPYPEAAVDLAGGLCKNFIITDKSSDYQDFAGGSCVAPPAP